MAKILVVGLNPAWQKIYELQRLRVGQVNRIGTLWSLASGKGMNVAKVLHSHGHDVELLQILAGEKGRGILQACGNLGIKSLHVWVEGETRTCTTLLDRETGSITELIEPFSVSLPDLENALLSQLERNAGYDAVVLCGTTPNGCAGDILERLVERANPGLSILDAYRDLSLSLVRRVSWLKINQEEYAELTVKMPAIFEDSGRLPYFLVTDGGDAAYLRQGCQELNRFDLPVLAGVVNCIGAGDTVTSGLAHSLLAGNQNQEACAKALAMGSASCLTLLPSEFDEKEYHDIYQRIRIRDPG